MTDLVPQVSWGVAFLAGLASFLSPCVAPLVPGYLAYVTGSSLDGEAQVPWWQVLGTTLLFVLGFTFVFVLLGASAGLLGGLLDDYRRPLNRVAGGVMVIMGLVLIGLGPALLKRDTRFSVAKEAFGPAGPVVLGMAFGFGWTPCIGPILASILFYAGFSETAGQSALLLAVYSLGLGVPFVVTGLGLSRAMGAWQWMRRWTGPINMLSGAGLVLIGILFATDRSYLVSLAAQRLASMFPGGGLVG